MKRHITPDLIRAALSCIPPDLIRDDWARVGMAIKSELGAEGFDLFDTWSQGSESYDASAAKETWRSVKGAGRVTIGTLFHLAKGYGFKFDDKPGEAQPDSASMKAMAEARKARDEAERKATEAAHRKAAELAAKLWSDATEATTSPYLERKGVKGRGVRVDAQGVLLVPMRDERGALWNLQSVASQKPASGPDKRFLKGGRKTGLMHWIGEPSGAGVLLLCEGFATGASLHEATGYPVCVTFDAGNLPSVAKALRGMWPAALLVMCGDNDKATQASTGRNPGKEKALQAAKAVQGVATWPDGLADGLTDFNDAHQTQGLEAVKARIQEAIQSMQDNSNQASQESKASGKPAAPDVPAQVDRFLVSDEGVFHLGQDREGRAMAPQRICGRLDVLARTRDEDGLSWGYLLAFKDPAGVPRTWAMPARMLAGEGGEYRATLMHMGFVDQESGASAKNLLTKYLLTRQPKEMARCVDRVGWHGHAYVLPRETLSQADDERIVLQSEVLIENRFKQRGTLAQWRDEVAALCVGNDRFLLSVCCAFAGALVRHSGVDSGGVHLRGGSSSGKTTALQVAASVFGGPNYVQRWRSTDNGIEGIAAQHCDGVLLLDELAQIDPKVAGECAYLLANEASKIRGGKSVVGARPVLTWRLLFLSAGEISLSQHMAEGGKRIKAGQELRMVDLPMDVGQGFNGFNVLHGLGSGSALSTHLKKVCEDYHGTAGRAWLQLLVEKGDALRDTLRAEVERYVHDLVPEAANGQVQRVGRRFALMAVAGELATESGITGWPQGEAARGVRACFNAWLTARGGIGDAEVSNMLRQVQRLLEERGASNFAWMNRVGDDRAPNPTERWGFRRLVDKKGKPITRVDDGDAYGRAVDFLDEEGTEIEYFVLIEAFRSKLCEGYDPVTVAHLLNKRGHLVPESSKRLDRKEYIKGQGYARVYRIKASILADDGGEA